MSRSNMPRALATEREREYLRGEHGKQRHYEAVSRIKKRMREELRKDIEVFEEHRPDMMRILREEVGESPETSDEIIKEIKKMEQ